MAKTTKSVSKKKDKETSSSIKTKDGEYIMYRLMSKSKGFIIETFGDDPTKCQEALDQYWFEWRRQRENGERKGHFDYYITKAIGMKCWEYPYVAGSLSNEKRRKNRRNYDYDDDYDEDYGNYEYDPYGV